MTQRGNGSSGHVRILVHHGRRQGVDRRFRLVADLSKRDRGMVGVCRVVARELLEQIRNSRLSFVAKIANRPLGMPTDLRIRVIQELKQHRHHSGRLVLPIAQVIDRRKTLLPCARLGRLELRGDVSYLCIGVAATYQECHREQAK